MNIFLVLGRVLVAGRIFGRKYYRLEVLHASKVNLARFIYFLIYGKISTFHVSLILLRSHSIGIFSCFAVMFIWLVGAWIAQKTLPARGGSLHM